MKNEDEISRSAATDNNKEDTPNKQTANFRRNRVLLQKKNKITNKSNEATKEAQRSDFTRSQKSAVYSKTDK